jgi:hypothetical protein
MPGPCRWQSPKWQRPDADKKLKKAATNRGE